MSLPGEPSSDKSALNPFPLLRAFSIFVVTALGFFYRWRYLTIPYAGDEAWTFIYFANSPVSEILTDYSFPNNHFLHTILMHLCYRLFGISEVGLRLPTFIAGLVIMPLTYLFAKRIFKNNAIALLSLFLTAISHTLIYYSVSARGYSLQTALVLIFAYYGLFSEARSPLMQSMVMSLLGVLILLTIPSGVVFIFPFFIFLLWGHKDAHLEKKYVWMALAIIMLVAFMFYLPFRYQLVEFARGNAGVHVQQNLWQFLKELIGTVGSGMGPQIVTPVFLIFTLILLVKWGENSSFFLLVIFFHLFLAVLLFRKFPFLTFFPRNYICLFPFIYMSFAFAVVTLVQRVPKKLKILMVAGFVLVFIFGQVDSSDQFFPYVSNKRSPEEKIWNETRELTRQIVNRLNNDEKIYTSHSSLAGEIIFYQVQKLGFTGRYGITNIYAKKIKNIYLIALSKEEVVDFCGMNLNPQFWSAPQQVATREHVLVFAVHRMHEELSPSDGPYRS